MSRWFRFHSDAIRNPDICRLSDKQYRINLNAALNGEKNEFSRFLSGPFTRPDKPVWDAIRAEVFARDNYTCTYCGAHGVKLECDHVVPVAKGGEHEMSNLTTACKPCNRSKAAKLIKDWVR